MGSTVEEQARFLAEAQAAKDQWAIDRIPNEGPQHRVRITRPFYLGKYEVTQAQWAAVMASNPSKFPGNPLQPVEQVSWEDIQPFLVKVNESRKNEGMKFALPTEAQWEYACRAGTTTFWHSGDSEESLRESGWFSGNAGWFSGNAGKTHPVGGLKGNGWGLYDMHGNVWEWCSDWHSGGCYGQSPLDDPSGPPSGSDCVIRGGSWKNVARSSRSAYRYYGSPGYRGDYLGLRLACEIPYKPESKPVLPGSTSSVPPPAWQLPPDAPPPAVALFDAQKAKKHQQAWSEYLDLPVEQDIDLPGGVKVAMVLIPPGEFLMGSTAEEHARFLAEAQADKDQWLIDRMPSEAPPHRVRITRPFYLGKYELTQGQWEAVMGSNPSQIKDSPSQPVEMVSWDDIQPFLVKVNESRKNEGMKFALPTESQWEYACRAGTTTYWHGGDSEESLRESDWFSANAGGKTHPVGELKGNGWGLYDMHGNVWEWCADWHSSDYYGQSPMDDPSGPPTGSHRVFRGGGWNSGERDCRSARRCGHLPGCRDNNVGLRLALVPAEE